MKLFIELDTVQSGKLSVNLYVGPKHKNHYLYDVCFKQFKAINVGKIHFQRPENPVLYRTVQRELWLCPRRWEQDNQYAERPSVDPV